MDVTVPDVLVVVVTFVLPWGGLLLRRLDPATAYFASFLRAGGQVLYRSFLPGTKAIVDNGPALAYVQLGS